MGKLITILMLLFPKPEAKYSDFTEAVFLDASLAVEHQCGLYYGVDGRMLYPVLIFTTERKAYQVENGRRVKFIGRVSKQFKEGR